MRCSKDKNVFPVTSNYVPGNIYLPSHCDDLFTSVFKINGCGMSVSFVGKTNKTVLCVLGVALCKQLCYIYQIYIHTQIYIKNINIYNNMLQLKFCAETSDVLSVQSWCPEHPYGALVCFTIYFIFLGKGYNLKILTYIILSVSNLMKAHVQISIHCWLKSVPPYCTSSPFRAPVSVLKEHKEPILVAHT